MGDRGSISLWNDFAADSPGQARIVIADVTADKQAAVQATKAVDRVLTKAEKKSKPKKPKNLTAPTGEPSYNALKENERWLKAMLGSESYPEREYARKELGL